MLASSVAGFRAEIETRTRKRKSVPTVKCKGETSGKSAGDTRHEFTQQINRCQTFDFPTVADHVADRPRKKFAISFDPSVVSGIARRVASQTVDNPKINGPPARRLRRETLSHYPPEKSRFCLPPVPIYPHSFCLIIVLIKIHRASTLRNSTEFTTDVEFRDAPSPTRSTGAAD